MGLAGPALEFYEHHSDFEEPDASRSRAALRLEQRSRNGAVGRGASWCRRLAAGHRFALQDHRDESLNLEWVVVRVAHRGETARSQRQNSGRHYQNVFSCVPAAVAFRPKVPRPVLRQVTETAIVVGPPGEEIHTDEYGRIKVQFHWDREGKRDEHSSAWIRVAQAWAGAQWGFQFIPRIGMEVLVTFLGGDQDRPMIIGAVYNGAHPTPFRLPQDKTRSGIRTQSTPRAVGHNELSFEDAVDREQVYLHAQRDLDEVVRRQHTVKVGADEHFMIGGNQTAQVAHDQLTGIGGSRTVIVEKNDKLNVLEDREELVEGHRRCTVVKDEEVSVHGHRTLTISQGETRIVSGGSQTIVRPKPRGAHEEEDGGHGFADATTVHGGRLTQVQGKEHVELQDRVTYVERHDELKVEQDDVVNAGRAAYLLVGDLGRPSTLTTGYYVAADAVRVGGRKDTLKELTLMRDKDSLSFTPEAIKLRSQGRDVIIEVGGSGSHIKLSAGGDIEICAAKKLTLKGAQIALVSGGGS